jgi:hypothetical protein
MRPVSETLSPETIERIKKLNLRGPANDWEPRHRPAGPAYPAVVVFGFNVDPRENTKARIPSIKFKGTDAQYQEVLDKANAKTIRRESHRPSKLDVKMMKLERKIRMMENLGLRNLEARVSFLEAIQEYQDEGA